MFILIYLRTLSNSTDELTPIMRWTKLAVDPDYNSYYYNIGTIIALGIVPTALLFYYNFMVCRGITSPNHLLERQDTRKKRYTQEANLAIVMIGIVVVFIVCHSLRNIGTVYACASTKEYEQCSRGNTFVTMPKWFEIMWSVSQLLLVINSSVNMIIYCCLNSKFKKQLVSLVKRISPHRGSISLIENENDHQDNENMAGTQLK